MVETKYKLFNTDGKTFFDFRSNPKSRCEGFTITHCDDGTVVMTGDYGCLCWKRNYNQGYNNFRHDYGFPNKDTNIGYFVEKICTWNFEPKIKEWDTEKAIEKFKEYYGDDLDNFNGQNITYREALEQMESLEHYDEARFYEILSQFDGDGYEHNWVDYKENFIEVFKKLKSVSEQIIEAVNKENNEGEK